MQVEEIIEYRDQHFEKSFPIKGIKETQFENCNFINCDLTEVNFSGCDFSNSTFESCNLSMLKLGYIGLDKVNFIGCKMVGSDFSNVKDFLFNARFKDCILDYAAFMKKKNRKGFFDNCTLKGADFSEADLTDTVFKHCDLSSTVFLNTILNGANFTTSSNFTIDPERNSLKKAKFSSEGLIGLLTKYGIIVSSN